VAPGGAAIDDHVDVVPAGLDEVEGGVQDARVRLDAAEDDRPPRSMYAGANVMIFHKFSQSNLAEKKLAIANQYLSTKNGL
jgi:hypothetical protein